VLPALVATGAAVSSAIPGMLASSARRRAGAMAPFSAGLLIGVVAAGLLPETAAAAGWAGAAALFACGYALLWAVNRIYPVCPSCSPGHDHTGCAAPLHGFAAPLVLAAGLHSFLDGWTVAAADSRGVGLAVAVALHKIPEGVALGALFAAAAGTRAAAMGWVLLAELPTLGGALTAAFTADFAEAWTRYPLGVAAGSLLFLGAHAIHNERKRRGRPAFLSAAVGVACAAALELGAAFFRTE
jgi:zinc transporter ZupT